MIIIINILFFLLTTTTIIIYYYIFSFFPLLLLVSAWTTTRTQQHVNIQKCASTINRRRQNLLVTARKPSHCKSSAWHTSDEGYARTVYGKVVLCQDGSVNNFPLSQENAPSIPRSSVLCCLPLCTTVEKFFDGTQCRLFCL